MRKYAVLVVTIIVSLFSCKSNKADNVKKAENQETSQFLEAFKPLKLPFAVADSGIADLAKTDTLSYSLFTQYVPDTVFNNPFGKNRKLLIYPVGKTEQKGKETYFTVFAKSKTQGAVYVFVYDKNKYSAGMPLLKTDEDNVVNSASIDKKLSIVVNDEWTIKNDRFYKRTIYAYNNAGIFTTVLTETNEDRSAAGIVNPFDTFPKRHKYSGDYAKGKKDVLFLRDGKAPNEYLFFVRFEAGDEQDPCLGQLKGLLKMTSDKTGVYTSSGDPCTLNFAFKSTEIKLTESGGCGNYRGIKCFFNNTFRKKIEPKVTGKKKK